MRLLIMTGSLIYFWLKPQGVCNFHRDLYSGVKSTELSFLVILQILARAGLVGVFKKCSLVKMNHQ